MDGVMAVVTTWAADFAPKNWATCDGQIISIAQNQALFSLLGTTYGGNGINTFGLPNLRGRTAVGTGQGSGLSNYVLGQVGGSPTVTLNVGNIPPHTHDGPVTLSLKANATDGGTDNPDGAFPGMLDSGYSAANPDAKMIPPTYTGAVAAAGSGMPVNNMSPYLAVNYIICMYGLFPTRN